MFLFVSRAFMESKKPRQDHTLYCCVKNCKKRLADDNHIKFGDCVFCKQCGAQIIKQSILG